MVIITLHNSKILLSLHYFLTPQFQTFTNLLIGIFGVSNPFFFFFLLRFLRNVSIIVNISNISNNTVLQCYLLWIFVLIKRLFQIIVCIGVSAPLHLKNMTPSFAIEASLLRQFTPPPPNNFSFHAPPPPTPPPLPKKKKKQIFQ